MPIRDAAEERRAPPVPDPPMTAPLVVPNVLSDAACEALVAAASNATESVRSHQLLDALGAPIPNSRRSDEVRVAAEVLRPLREALAPLTDTCRTHFATPDLEVLRPARLLRYRRGDAISQHRDAGLDVVAGRSGQRIVSFSLLLSDPRDFTGGDLIGYGLHRIPGFERLGKVLALEQGDAVFFLSQMQHEVTEVTEGTRLVAIGHLGSWLD